MPHCGMTYPYVWVCSPSMRQGRGGAGSTFRGHANGYAAPQSRGNNVRNLVRGLLVAGLFLVGMLLVAPWAMANTGVAFVHGTGAQTNAYQDYWQPKMV